MECSFKPYEGDAPYIFVSYSHNDTPSVLFIMEELNKAGFRIWYDKGIEWNSIWTSDMQRHLEKCSVIISFISKTALSSPLFLNRIIYAYNKRIHLLPLCLEFIPLPQELNLIFQQIPLVNFCGYNNCRENYIDWLRNLPILQPAKIVYSFAPYEGNEPFIFVSYSHNDTQNIFLIIDELNKAGFRIWYDKGIEWGSIWTMDLVNHINKCNVVMAFISRNSICSPHCQNEILYAASISKHFFPIYLERILLPQNLYAIFNHIQAAKFYEYEENHEQFIERLREATILQATKGRASDAWSLAQGEKHFNEKNYIKAFEYLRQAADSTQYLISIPAANLIQKILNESNIFKRMDEANKKYFQAYLRQPHASSQKDKPKCEGKFSITMEEFEKQISKERN